MTREQALNRLGLMTAASTDPALTPQDLEALLDLGARPDPGGNPPGTDGWTGTWALGAAAAEGWRWKAGRVTDRVDMAGDDTRLNRSQLHAHCMRMAERYDRAAWTVTPIGRTPNAARSPFALPGARERLDNTW